MDFSAYMRRSHLNAYNINYHIWYENHENVHSNKIFVYFMKMVTLEYYNIYYYIIRFTKGVVITFFVVI